jgi:hypothetical protein
VNPKAHEIATTCGYISLQPDNFRIQHPVLESEHQRGWLAVSINVKEDLPLVHLIRMIACFLCYKLNGA